MRTRCAKALLPCLIVVIGSLAVVWFLRSRPIAAVAVCVTTGVLLCQLAQRTCRIAVTLKVLPPRRRVQICPRVSCNEVPDLEEAPDYLRSALWWQKHDFLLFAKVRKKVAQTYKKIARQKDVPHGNPFLPQALSLAGESRRGLDLGRAKLRQKTTTAHLKAVMEEQQSQCDGKSPNDDELRVVSRRFSERDRMYAVEKAFMDYRIDVYEPLAIEDDVNDAAEESIKQEDIKVRSRANSDDDGVDHPPLSPLLSSTIESVVLPPPADLSPSDTLFNMQRGQSFILDEKRERRTSFSYSSCGKGYGLTREELEQFGLNATGREQRRENRQKQQLQDSDGLSSNESVGVINSE